MRPGVRVAVDVGTARVGVAASDVTATLASPVTVLRRQRRLLTDLDEIATIVRDREAVEVVVGWPRSLKDTEGPAAESARTYAQALAARVEPVPVRLVDERLTTVVAQRALHAAGRTVRSSRGQIDAAAAVVILQSALDSERNAGTPPGEVVTP
ncbi:MAG: Holliday junction resolvase RuvX [Frankiales bacterium]|nr:Holliday junction resolvase RuvX [Frankiales bacterium]